MALGILALLRAIGRRLWDESAGVAAALLFILSPVTLYYAKNANLDIPYVFWLAAALLVYVRILQERRSAGLSLAWDSRRAGRVHERPGVRIHPLHAAGARAGAARRAGGMRWRASALGALGFAVPFALIHNVLFDFAGFWRHVKMILGPASEGWREVALGPVGQARLLVETLLRLMDAWTPAGLALAVARNRGRVAPARKARPVDRHADTAGVLLRLLPDAYRLRVSALHAPDDAGAGAVCGTRRGLALAPALAGRRRENRRPPRWSAGSRWPAFRWTTSCRDYARYDAQMWLERHASAATRLRYIGADRDMPRFNKPLDAKPVEPEDLASLQPPADLLVLSFEQGHPATGSRSTRLGAVLRRRLGDWGLIHGKSGGKDFYERLVAGELGYKEAARFESPIGAFVPEVAESVNRTIVILERAEK